MLVDLSISPEKTAERIISFLKTTIKKAGFSKAAIGLSGGIDSSVVFYLTAKTLDAKNIYPCLFPYGDFDMGGLDDTRTIIKKIGVSSENIYEQKIDLFVDSIIKKDKKISVLRKGNIIVRARMLLLYDWAKENNALVIGTENRTEYLLGYFTRYGDEASDLEPIIDLYKTQVRQLASFLKVPERIISKAPTAGMWKGQTDEGELGFSYKEADCILHLFLDKEKSVSEITNAGFSISKIHKVLDRMKENQFKHRLPYICRLN